MSRLSYVGHPLTILTEQHRFVPRTRRLVLDTFYDSLLIDNISVRERPLPLAFREAMKSTYKRDRNVLLINFVDRTTRPDSLKSRFDESRVVLVMSLVRDLLKNPAFTPADITILAAYTAQFNLYRRAVVQLQGEVKEKREALRVEIFDGFQGKESSICSINTAATATVGFLAEADRINVALSCARDGLVVITDSDRLGQEKGNNESICTRFFQVHK